MAVASMRGFGGGQSNVMMMRNESISDSLVAMLGSCASPHVGLQGIGQKRPFFPSYNDGPTVDEGEDGEDGGDDCSQQVEKKRRLTFDQVRSLEKNFEIENKLEPERKMQLAKELGLQPRQVAVWFQNRRARWKIKQLERDYEALTVDYNRLKANLEVALRDKDNLKAEVKRLKGNNNNSNSNSLSVAVKGCAGADPSTQCRSEALSPSSVLQVDHDSYSDRPSSENIIQLPSKNFQNNSSAGPLKEESRRTTSSDSNVSSDVVEGDSPRTGDSCSLSTRMQHHPDQQQEQWTHCNPHFPSDNSFNVGVDELSQQLAFQRGAAVKLEDGIGYNADQPFLMSRLDVDQSAFPWWDWP